MDRKIRTRLIVRSGLFAVGIIGLMTATYAAVWYRSAEFRWHSANHSYIGQSVFIHHGRVVYWSAHEVAETNPGIPLVPTLVGAASLQRSRLSLEKAREELNQTSGAPSSTDAVRRIQLHHSIEEGSFEYQRELAIQSAASVARDKAHGGFFLSRTGYPIRETLFQFPLWVLTLPFLLLSCSGLKIHTIFRRARAGACLHCGYDLRASSGERCPECGRKILRTNPAKAGRGPIARHKIAAGFFLVASILLFSTTVSFWHPLHYDHWPVSDLLAAPAPQWTHVMIANGCLTLVRTASGNPPEYGLDKSEYAKASKEYIALLRKEVPSGFAFERKMIVPVETQARLRSARSRLVERMMSEGRESYLHWTAEVPERQLVFSTPLWPALFLLVAWPGFLLFRTLRDKWRRTG